VGHRGDTGLFDWGAFLLVSALGAIMITYGIEAALSPTGLKYGGPAAPYLVFGAIASLAAIGDIRMLRRGVSGKQRIARHLWRMCFALFVASASIFLARAHLFPVLLQKTGVLSGLSFLPLGLLIFWMFRVRFAKRAMASILASTEQPAKISGETSAKTSPLAKDSWSPVTSPVRSKPFTSRPTDLERVG
jgi:hypothetical protein